MAYVRAVLLALRQKLPQWVPYIKNAAHVNEVEFSPQGSTGDFTVTVKWGGSVPGEYKRLYNKGYVVASGSSMLQAVAKQKICRFVDDLIFDVLKARGVK